MKSYTRQFIWGIFGSYFTEVFFRFVLFGFFGFFNPWVFWGVGLALFSLFVLWDFFFCYFLLFHSVSL